MPLSRKARLFWPVATAVLLIDCATKAIAVRQLSPPHIPHEVLGKFLRLTLTYNAGGAMNLSFGMQSRLILSAVAVLALGIIYSWYRRLPPEAHTKLIALGLVWAGAAGNLWDRLRYSGGVVDFIDMGIGDWRFWAFNVADLAITIGALILAVSHSRADSRGAV